ncbi:MAG: TatD family hydrolase [Bacteroidales bacterium]
MERNRVKKLINIHAHKQLNKDEYVILNRSPKDHYISVQNNEPFSSGIHPWRAGNETGLEQEIAELRSIASGRLMMAVGESGLDRSRGASIAVQQKVFDLQADIAAAASKPMIIHCVRAFPELISLRKKYEKSPPWIVHGFSGNSQIMEQLISHGFFLSLGPSIINPPSKMAELLLMIPLQKIFFETDDTDGRVEEIYNTFARLRGIGVLELAEQIRKNFSVIWPHISLNILQT